MSVFDSEVYFLYAAKLWILVTYPSILSAYAFLLGKLSPLILRDIRDQWMLVPDIFVVTGGITSVYFSSFGFVVKD